MNPINKKDLIENLFEIKKSICLGAGGGVTCVAFMHNSQETIVERLDFMLLSLGVTEDQLNNDFDETNKQFIDMGEYHL